MEILKKKSLDHTDPLRRIIPLKKDWSFHLVYFFAYSTVQISDFSFPSPLSLALWEFTSVKSRIIMYIPEPHTLFWISPR